MVPGTILKERGDSKHLDITAKNGARHHFLMARYFLNSSLSSPSERNHARSAFLTVFHHTAFAKLGNPTESGGEYV